MEHYIKVIEGYGRGIVALYDIPKDKLLFTAELLVLNPEDTIKVNSTDLKHYTFKYNDTQDCLVLGDGEIFNHDDNANVGYKLIDYGDVGRKVMAFYAIKDIKAQEQMFINYAADTNVDAKAYIVNLIG